jgi:hypothetical protein
MVFKINPQDFSCPAESAAHNSPINQKKLRLCPSFEKIKKHFSASEALSEAL